MATHNMILFERITKYPAALFDYAFQEGTKINCLNITIFQIVYGIIIDQT